MFGELLKLMSEGAKLRDLSQLKDSGEVTEETEERGDVIVKRTHYRSYDGSTVIHREQQTTKNAERFNELYDLRRQINRLLRDLNFEEAIPLRDRYKALYEELKPSLPEPKQKKK